MYTIRALPSGIERTPRANGYAHADAGGVAYNAGMASVGRPGLSPLAHAPVYPQMAVTPHAVQQRASPSSPCSSPPMPSMPPSFSASVVGPRTPQPPQQQQQQQQPALEQPKAAGLLATEVARRQAAEARVQQLESLVSQLRRRLAVLEGGNGKTSSRGGQQTSRPMKNGVVTNGTTTTAYEDPPLDDPIDRSICEYLERNPDFPVSIQKVAPNNYVFGDRGTVYITQRGQHTVVRVGGGFKSLQVFMDERALMVTSDNAALLSQRSPRH
eukprot:TRINITY_DN537_c1_g1_i1.p1 TRINITY_DN537_c1_g1~~TRINITY_DN537_c1_g1_i1.p1  ORF type:complete len:270 (+),score=54.95 TRINITY_DN537_c1_g1_i1:63-872(+)